MSQDVYVFADWDEFDEATLVGTLRSDVTKSKEFFRFIYDNTWLQSEFAQQIDPELHLN